MFFIITTITNKTNDHIRLNYINLVKCWIEKIDKLLKSYYKKYPNTSFNHFTALTGDPGMIESKWRNYWNFRKVY